MLKNAPLIRNVAETDSSLAAEIANELRSRFSNSDGCPRLLEELSHYVQYLRNPTIMTKTRDENYVYENDPIEIEAKKMAGESYEDLKREMPDIGGSPLMVFARECSRVSRGTLVHGHGITES